MRFSIIIPVYNAEKYLSQCVNSILTQSYSDFEVILVDDGSPDSSPQQCNQYLQADHRVKVIHKSNGGQSDARNAGLDIATGDYIIFVDSDDWWYDKNALRNIAEIIDNVNCEILIFGMGKYNEKTRKYFDIQIPRKPSANNYYLTKTESIEFGIFKASPCDKVIKKALIDKLNLRFRRGQFSEDIEWCIKLLHNVDYIAVLPQHIYVYRQNDASISHNVGRKNVEDILSIIKRYTAEEYKTDDALINFIALQFVFLIATCARVRYKDIRDLLDEMNSYTYLLDHTMIPQVKIAHKFKFMGVKGMRILMKLYQQVKQ